MSNRLYDAICREATAQLDEYAIEQTNMLPEYDQRLTARFAAEAHSLCSEKQRILSRINFHEETLVFGTPEDAKSIILDCYDCESVFGIFSWPGAELVVKYSSEFEQHRSHHVAAVFSGLTYEELKQVDIGNVLKENSLNLPQT